MGCFHIAAYTVWNDYGRHYVDGIRVINTSHVAVRIQLRNAGSDHNPDQCCVVCGG
jgi:hypothetical protein